MADIYRRLLDKVGVGGIKCYCCNPSRNIKNPQLKNSIKRQLKRGIKNLIKELDNNEYYEYNKKV